MANQYKAQVQHSVPQFVLERFSFHSQIWVYDKHADRSFRTNTKNVMGERSYNTVSLKNAVLDFESRLSHIESIGAPVLKKIVHEYSVTCLSPSEVAHLCTFVTSQLLRTKQHRRTFELLRTEMIKRVPSLAQEELLKLIGPDELDKLSSLQFLSENLEEFTKHLILKHIILVRRNCSGTFYISDNPVVLHNDSSFGPYGNLGIAVPGIQLYYPLSPDLVIAFLCPTLLENLQAELVRAQKLINQKFTNKFLSPTGITQLEALEIEAMKVELKKAARLYEQMRDERRIEADTDNLLFLNSLQIMQSFRFVAAKSRHFDLVERAMRERPAWRKPDNMKVA